MHACDDRHRTAIAREREQPLASPQWLHFRAPFSLADDDESRSSISLY
jgi:hypothetical protein